MKGRVPTWEEISHLPALDAGVVHAGQIDVNRHMNVNEYFPILTMATITACGEYGLDLSYPVSRGMGLFSVDHHARYLHELAVGDAYTAHAHVLDATDRGARAMAYLVHSSSRQVVSTLETVLLNVSLATRRVAPFADDTVLGLREGLAHDRAREVYPELCASMRLPGRPVLAR